MICYCIGKNKVYAMLMIMYKQSTYCVNGCIGTNKVYANNDYVQTKYMLCLCYI